MGRHGISLLSDLGDVNRVARVSVESGRYPVQPVHVDDLTDVRAASQVDQMASWMLEDPRR